MLPDENTRKKVKGERVGRRRSWGNRPDRQEGTCSQDTAEGEEKCSKTEKVEGPGVELSGPTLRT